MKIILSFVASMVWGIVTAILGVGFFSDAGFAVAFCANVPAWSLFALLAHVKLS